MDKDRLDSLKPLTTVMYGLKALRFMAGITAIVMNYVKKEDVAGAFLASHFRWQISTFWFGLLWTGFGFVTLILLVGWVVWAANTVGIIYRVVKGWLRLNDRLSMFPD